ncbi:glutamate ABC transporter substrate-binding protein [Microbacterium sp. ARD32]|uniref:glutamate ABC transporter substrate-binding protein n=1 Tax=Microbacterium sp. ARD32 TaxID=2962577 RepID=UPI0028818D45|nr:glutamate ABC transporter substrate-binding protein [Microbacterium sp. ARD32]MDT0158594.1 glutamate ABC transporter substrate-binding protein [Microbacterium sp. ARD32]
MRRTKALAGIGIAAAALLALTGCNSGSPTSPGGGTGGDGDGGDSGAIWQVAKDVSLDGSPTFDKMKKADGVTVGVKEDQPGLGYLDPTTNERSGFDVDIARWIAASLGFDEKQITYKPIASANREQAIKNGDVDYYVGTYSITDKRKQDIDFAGPYFVTGQGLLVRKDSGIDDVEDLSAFNGKTVCSATGSTPIQNIKANYPEIKTKEYDIYSGCVEDLLSGSVDAVTTDQAILIGYAAQHPDDLKIVGGLFTEERYGVGLPKGDTVLKDHINKLFTDGHDVWQKIFDKNLGKSGIKVDQPEVD